MRAMVLNRLRTPLVLTERDDRLPGPGEIRVTVRACGVCRTDLHVADGDLPDPLLPISDIPSFAYRLLWEERQVVSVANLTRYKLEQANQALADLRAGRFEGAAVLVP